MKPADATLPVIGRGAISLEDFQPVHQEVTSDDLHVTGTVPDFLDGRYLRNGPNPIAKVDPRTYHMFSGDAMVHGVSLRGGRAQWYRNRWIRTPSASKALGETLRATIKPSHGMTVVSPSTNVISHAGHTLALVEGGMASYDLTDKLDTVGTCDFGGTLTGGYSAHPQVDPDSGEMHAVSYTFGRPNTVQYSVIGHDGRARRTVDISVHGQTMMHSFTLTEKYVVFYDLPVTFDAAMLTRAMPLPRPLRKPMELVNKSVIGKVRLPDLLATRADRLTRIRATIPYSWNPKYPARIGVMPRGGGNSDVRWFEIEPCYVFHAVNGYSETRGSSEVLVIDLIRYDTMFDKDLQTFSEGFPALNRWTIDLTCGTVQMERIDDRWLEFPKINETFIGKKHRYGYLPNLDGLRHNAVVDKASRQLIKVDYATGSTRATDFDRAVKFGEMSFVPNPSAKGEDDGVLIGYVTDRRTGGQLLILDAPTLELMATVHLPQRVPAGFHGNWAPREATGRPDER